MAVVMPKITIYGRIEPLQIIRLTLDDTGRVHIEYAYWLYI
jgi:hypothetical protein